MHDRPLVYTAFIVRIRRSTRQGLCQQHAEVRRGQNTCPRLWLARYDRLLMQCKPAKAPLAENTILLRSC